MSGGDPKIIPAALDWLAEGRQVALATVIETWGSSPQPVGSKLLADANGNFAGSVSGGCVEASVVTEAAEVDCRSRDRGPFPSGLTTAPPGMWGWLAAAVSASSSSP